LNDSLAHRCGSTPKQKASSSHLWRHIHEAFFLVVSPWSLDREEICFDSALFWFGGEGILFVMSAFSSGAGEICLVDSALSTTTEEIFLVMAPVGCVRGEDFSGSAPFCFVPGERVFAISSESLDS
jgi:hypothetical protein